MPFQRGLVIACLNINSLLAHIDELRITILGLQSISRDVAHNASHPRRLDPTMELIKYSFVLYLQHGRHDVKCKPSMYSTKIDILCINETKLDSTIGDHEVCLPGLFARSV